MRKLRFLAVMLLSLFLWQSTEIRAAATEASVNVTQNDVEKTFTYWYEFTQTGSDVTFTFYWQKATSITDLQLNQVYEDTNGEANITANCQQTSDETYYYVSYTWSNKSVGNILKIRPYLVGASGVVIQPRLEYTVTSGSATPDNLALNKAAIATSGTASSSVDGNMATSWDSNQSDPQTWQVDLGSSKTFNAIVIYWEGAYAKTFTIEAGNDVDGETGYLTGGTPIATVTGQTLTGSFPYKQVIPVNSTTARYIKFTGTKRANDAWSYRIWEFEVYNDASLTTSNITITSANTTAGAVSKLAGETEQFTYTAINSSSQPVTPGARTWASSNTAVGTIDANGLFTAVGPGTTNITLTSGGVVSNTITVTVTIPAPTTIPTIKTVGSTVGGKTITEVKPLYDQGTKQNGFDFTAWGSHTDPTAATVDGKTISLFSNFSYLGGQYTDFDATQWDKLVIDIYPMTSMNGVQIFPINAGKTEYNQSFNPTVGQWNTLEVDLQTLKTSGLDITNLNQLKVNNASGAEFYVGNIYYYSTQNITYAAPTDVPDIITSFNDGTTTYTIESDQVTKIYTVAGNAPTNFNFDELYNHYGETSSRENVSINSKQAVKFVNFDTVIGKGFNEVSLSSANYLHVDIYPMSSFNVAVYPAQNANGVQLTNLTPGQWNSIDIPMSSLNNPTSITEIMLTQNVSTAGTEDHSNDIKNVTLYLGNYYFFRTATVPDTEAPVMATATVGNIGTTTATLTVRATDNKAGNLTYNIYNGSVATENLLTTATGTAGSDKVVELTGLTQGGTYNLVVTATDAASNTSESMAVAEFTTQDYIPTLTTIYVRMKGESTDAYNVAKTEPGVAQCTIQIIALDQKGNDMPTRQMRLRIVDGNTGTNDVKLVETENVRTVPKSSEEGSTSIQKFNHVGRVTIEAVDNLTGKTGYGFLTFYDAANTADTNEDQLISNPAQVASAKITGANESIIRLAADGHGTNNYVSDGAHPAEFVVDWSSIQDNQQHYEYYDIDMIQVLYQQGKFPSDYTIAVSHDGGETYEDVYHYDGTQEFYNPSTNPGFRADGWNASRQLTQAVSHIRFRSNNNDAIAFDAFKVYGKINNTVDNNPPTLTAEIVDGSISTNQGTKTSTAQIKLKGIDDNATTISYTLTSSTGMQYTTSGNNDTEITYDFQNTLVPGTHYVFTVVASDGRNRSNPETVEFTTPALASAPVVSAEAVNVNSVTATINYWLPSEDNTATGEDDDIIFTVKRGTAVVKDSKYKKGEADENNKVDLNLTGLSPATTYTYTITATNNTNGLSSETSVTFTTHKGGSDLTIWYKAGESDTEHGPYEGWTGELEKLITATDKGHQVLTEVTNLRIKGSLNNEDIKLLRRMAGGSTYVGETNVKKRVLIKAENAPNVYAWVDGSDPVQELLGELPGTLITKKTDGYYEVEFTNTETVKIRINSQTTEFTLAEGNNYFTYDGTTYTQVVENNSYGILATLDLKEASFYHDGGVYMVAIKNNNNNPISLELEYGAVVTKADIGNSMFRECSQLKNVILPDDCKIVGERAFYGGKVDDGISLERVTLPTGLERIEGYAFEKNEELGEVTLPSSLTFIGYDAFRDCKAMTLGNENGQLPNNITQIDDWGFAGTSITEVILPNSPKYTMVDTNVFGWTKLQKVTIPANVTTLMDGAFTTNPELKEIVFENNINNITEIGDGAFWSNTKLPSGYINRLIENLTVLNNNVFNSCLALETLDIPASVITLKDLTFANCTNLRRVTVNSDTAPTGYTVTNGEMKNAKGEITDPFAAVNANHMTLTFAKDAVDGYKSYREGTAQSNAFHRLLTKTLDEAATSYDVAGQMHADVVLKRTMVEGWNTVALPFGVNKDNTFSENDRDRSYKYAGVYKEAFNGDVAENNNFMIAAYRGIDNDVFKFLKYANYEQDPLDEFEPLLIRMGSGNISPSHEYTFEDVDLNYDVEENRLYRDGNANEEVPVKRWVKADTWEAFIGNYNREGADAIAPFVNCKDDYAFMGTYTTKTTSDWKKADGTITYEGGTPYAYTNLPSGYFLTAEDDYIIQGNKFYKVVSTNSYGLRGYRAWFQKQPTTAGARPAQLMFRVVELDGDTPTEIDSFDAIDNDVKPFDVYSIGGQLLRKQTKSLNGLPNGIYIVNGRKVAVGK